MTTQLANLTAVRRGDPILSLALALTDSVTSQNKELRKAIPSALPIRTTCYFSSLSSQLDQFEYIAKLHSQHYKAGYAGPAYKRTNVKTFKIPIGAKATFFGKFLEAQRLRVLTLLEPVWSDASFSSKFITGNLSFQQINVELNIFSSGSRTFLCTQAPLPTLH